CLPRFGFELRAPSLKTLAFLKVAARLVWNSSRCALLFDCAYGFHYGVVVSAPARTVAFQRLPTCIGGAHHCLSRTACHIEGNKPAGERPGLAARSECAQNCGTEFQREEGATANYPLAKQ